MPNPYKGLPDRSFWKKAISESQGTAYPSGSKKPRLPLGSKITTAGSCFAQNLTKFLAERHSVQLLRGENLREGDPPFSARYANIYSAAQMLQLVEESLKGTPDSGCAIQRRDGRFVDRNRPFIEPEGFATAREVIEAREAHLATLPPLFAEADLFVFTLGLTEAWVASGSGRVLPSCPGIYSDDPGQGYAFKNFTFAEVLGAMTELAETLTALNGKLQILLTVSPVPLTATYSQEHVLVASSYSKSVLRAVCGELAAARPNVFYFPSYEIVTNPFVEGCAFDGENRRTVKPEAVEAVLRFFEREYLPEAGPDIAAYDEEEICDDVELQKSIGFE